MGWFRFYNDTSHDIKIRRLTREMDCKLVETVGVWATLLEIASKSPERGKLLVNATKPYSLDDIADELGLSPERTQQWLQALQNCDMISSKDAVICITNCDGNRKSIAVKKR